MSKSSNERYYKLKNQHICVKCGKQKTNGQVYCDECYKKIIESGIKLREKRKKLGLCPSCGTIKTYRDKKKNGKSYKLCYKCRDYNKKYREMMKNE